ncbi:MAG: 2,3-diphosphoglycerate-dependent phosphoglycerate mutase [Actinomycetota bacterium]|nr:2,3-diphosphoglycerate-dependent phosphoglycerate mutase [Actinomycetota bacterium]
MSHLVLIRHGESVWNHENRFTGWVDVSLSETGRVESRKAGERLASEGIRVGRAFTSALSRAVETGRIVLDLLGQGDLRPQQSWHLNERYYGALTGRNKDEAREEFGTEQVHIWRRSYATRPPGGESLRDMANRALPYFYAVIVPTTQEVDAVLVSAHGNSLRSIVKELDGLDDEAVSDLEMPLSIPVVYDMADGKPIGKRILE